MNLNCRTILAVLALTVCLFIMSGCGDTFRPTITPVFKPGGDPASLGQAVVLSTNPAGNGSTMHINTSGDTNVGVVTVGPNPVFLGRSVSQALAVNGNNSATLYIALLPTSTTINTVTLPASTSGAVASGLGNDVTVFSSIDNSFVKTIPVGSQPIWALMSSDTGAVYVVNQGDGTVSVIDTGIDKVITTIPVGASPNFAFFDQRLKRIYVTSTGSSTVSVIKGDTINLGLGIVPTKITDITLSGAPTSIVALSDGTRAYAALGGCPVGVNHTNLLSNLASCTGNRVSVIDVIALHETKTITVGSGAVSIDAAGDATRVYSVNANDKNVSIIRTSTDTELQRMPAPQQDLTCTSACALQTPFTVQVFP